MASKFSSVTHCGVSGVTLAARITQTAAVLAATSCVPTSGSPCGLRRYTAGRVTAVRGAPISSGLPGLIRQPMVTARSAAGTPLIFAAYLLAM
jgi:hypothetical protein